jgi:hypothetical protein
VKRADPFTFFDVIYCINLDRRPDRWLEAQAEFAALGIAGRVERVAGIDLSQPQLGCCLSHIECARRAARAGAETALVLEDDVTFPGFSPARLARSLERLRRKPDWELFYLGGHVEGWPVEIRPHLFRARIAQTHAYALHRRAFARVLDALPPIDLWYARTLTTYAARPLQAWQRDSVSDIDREWTSRAGVARRQYELHVAPPPPVVWLRRTIAAVRGRLRRGR